jgi:hypothetical protein
VNEEARSDLVRKLGAVYNDAWDDEAMKDRLIAEPRTVLADHGIELPATVQVEAELLETGPNAPQGTLDEFFAAWNGMIERGTVELKVLASRPTGVSTRELSDEDLERVSGGGNLTKDCDYADLACKWLTWY